MLPNHTTQHVYVQSETWQTDFGYHSSGRMNWWLRDEDGDCFVQVPAVRGDRQFAAWLNLAAGAYTLGVGRVRGTKARGSDIIRQQIVVTETDAPTHPPYTGEVRSGDFGPDSGHYHATYEFYGMMIQFTDRYGQHCWASREAAWQALGPRNEHCAVIGISPPEMPIHAPCPVCSGPDARQDPAERVGGDTNE